MRPDRFVAGKITAVVFRAVFVLATLIPQLGQSADKAPAGSLPLGINLSGITDWSSELVFVDAFRSSRTWISQEQGKPWGQGGPLDVDEHGWIRSLRPKQFAETVVFTDFGTRYPAGEMHCYYRGDGDIDLTGDARVTARQPGHLTVDIQPKHGSAFLRITRTNSDDPVREIRLLPAGVEPATTSDFRSGPSPFRPEFLKRWHGFQSLRFMDWQHTNGSPLVDWNERSTPAHATQTSDRGVAVEYQIRLANELNADPWFCMPHRASDEFVREFATLVKRELKPERRVYIEYSNECWNGQFAQARYCAERGRELGLSKNAFEAQLRYYSQRSVEIFQIWEQVFGGRERLVRVLATQAVNPWTGTTVMDWRDAYKQTDAIAIAPYFGNELGDPRHMDEVTRTTVDQVLDRCRESLIARRETTRKYADEARRRNLRLVAYEGGQHLAGYGGAENNEALTRLLHAANRDPRMRALYVEDLQGWRDAGGDLFCIFSSMGNYSKWGSWGVFEHAAQSVDQAPKYQALQEFLPKSK